MHLLVQDVHAGHRRSIQSKCMQGARNPSCDALEHGGTQYKACAGNPHPAQKSSHPAYQRHGRRKHTAAHTSLDAGHGQHGLIGYGIARCLPQGREGDALDAHHGPGPPLLQRVDLRHNSKTEPVGIYGSCDIVMCRIPKVNTAPGHFSLPQGRQEKSAETQASVYTQNSNCEMT